MRPGGQPGDGIVYKDHSCAHHCCHCVFTSIISLESYGSSVMEVKSDNNALTLKERQNYGTFSFLGRLRSVSVQEGLSALLVPHSQGLAQSLGIQP